MRVIVHLFLSAVMIVAITPRTRAADMFVYPKNGQTQEKQDQDSYECYTWAKAQSGVDPSKPLPPPKGGQVTRGTVGGAALGAGTGAAVGAIAGSPGKGAAAGAVVGGVAGRHRAKTMQQQKHAEKRNAYDRAFAACMEGRGYTVR